MHGDPNRIDTPPQSGPREALDPRSAWQEAAACRSEDPDLFFPVSGEGLGAAQTLRAKAVCARCPVVSACGDAAMAVGEAHGVWGGMDERDRRRRMRAGTNGMSDRPGLAPAVTRAARQDVRAAAFRLPGASRWLDGIGEAARSGPLVAEVWAFDVRGRRILLVEHAWRGLVPPGGKVEAGETPRRAAARELFEETGLSAVLLHKPAMAFVRRFRPDSAATTLGLSYAAVVDPARRLRCEPNQPAAWFDLDEPWPSCHPGDRDRMRCYLTSLLQSR
ncbi:WhiB family transcriptional regulator [Kitasatospora sp. NPDC059571]|uniref:WhiB family transcriptional regulator n=1 Tax=Kitasatospora sp. NPDC059571 TaxID=3346871 RepID=UPI0036A1E079